MKKLILLFSFFVLSPKLYSQIWQENFSYPAGDTLANYWMSLAPLGVDYIKVSSPGLIFPSYAGSGIGNAAKLDTTTPDAVAHFFDIPGISVGSVYGSFMVRVFSARSTGNYFAGIAPMFGIGDTHSRVFIKDSSGRVAFGISKKTESPIYTPAQYLRNTTYLLILKYTFNPGSSNDSVSLFVFSSPPPFLEPMPSLGPKGGTDPDMSNAAAFNLLQGFGGIFGAIVDGIYVDVAWNNIVLPVELSSFEAIVNIRDIILNWSTAAEVNNLGFDIEIRDVRRETQDIWSKVGFVPGNGTSTSSHNYSFTNKGLRTGKYNYRLKQIDFNGNLKYFNLGNDVVIGVPNNFNLSQNYPNPFNPSTKINYDLPFDAKVSIKLFNISGKEIETLVNDVQPAGYYTIDFNGSNLASAAYFYRIIAEANGQSASGGFVATKKMVILK